MHLEVGILLGEKLLDGLQVLTAFEKMSNRVCLRGSAARGCRAASGSAAVTNPRVPWSGW